MSSFKAQDDEDDEEEDFKGKGKKNIILIDQIEGYYH